MLGLLLLAACMWWGVSIVGAFRVEASPEERLVVGTILGLATGTWIAYLITYAAGGLDAGVLALSIAVLAAGGLVSRGARPAWPLAPWFLGLAAAIGAALLWMNLRGVLAPGPEGSVLAAEHIWADTPFHTSIISSFAHRSNIPPHYPLALSSPLEYPFMIDFLSGALLRGGLGLRWSLIVPNLIVQLSFFCAVALLALRLTGSRRAAVLSAGVLFCLGNFGWLAAPRDAGVAGSVGDWLRALPWSYTGDALGDLGRERLGTGVYLGNPTFMFLLPRRSGAFGLAVGAALLLLLDDLAVRGRARTAVLCGLVLGALPRIHAHTAMAGAAFAGASFALLPVRRGIPRWRAWLGEWRRSLPVWGLAAVLAVVLALPQVLSIGGQASGFFSWWPGWTGEPHDALANTLLDARLGRAVGRAALETARFWWYNGGLLASLLVPALVLGGRGLGVWYAPFAILWVFGNVVRTQPWEWDNVNFFVWWQVGTTVVVCAWLARLMGAGAVRRALAALAVGGLVVGGLLSFAFGAQQRMVLWTRGEMRFAAWVREHTPPDAVVLTATGEGHTHPVNALSGRQVYAGWQGWLFSHGLDWQRYEYRLERMFAGDVGLMRRLGVDYVVLGPFERRFADELGIELGRVFGDPAAFRSVYHTRIGRSHWRVMKLL